MSALKLKDFSKPLEKMSPEQLRRGIVAWLQNGGTNGGDEFTASEYTRLLKEGADHGNKAISEGK